MSAAQPEPVPQASLLREVAFGTQLQAAGSYITPK